MTSGAHWLGALRLNVGWAGWGSVGAACAEVEPIADAGYATTVALGALAGAVKGDAWLVG
eukprot:213631-Chlamydomonas_euryale.AAC.1